MCSEVFDPIIPFVDEVIKVLYESPNHCVGVCMPQACPPYMSLV